MWFQNRYANAGLSLLFLISLWAAAQASAEQVDHAPWGELLSSHVHAGVVDYGGFKRDEQRLDQYLHLLENARPAEMTPPGQLAFYINAYNAWTIKLVLGAYPGITSIKELATLFSSPWKKRICRIDGRILSLDEIEHGIIRPRFRDPRIHFALNCASRGCPPLASAPYREAQLEDQLEAAAQSFINDPSRYRLAGNDLQVSMIFKWYASDFEGGPLAFILRYAQGALREALLSRGSRIRLRYLDYDWSLNGP